MKGKIGVIGGTGVYSLEGLEVLETLKVDTPYGAPSDEIIRAIFNGVECYFLPRHGKHHQYLPSEINYRANIYALKKLGIKTVIAVSAVGSLKEEYKPGTFVLPDQFIDWTHGRKRSFFGEGILAHVSCARPVNTELQERMAKACVKAKADYYKNGTYICIDGPQFSTKAESKLYRTFGCDIIGMTNATEAFLCKEAQIAYSTIAMVTDYDCWKDTDCTLEEVIKVMHENKDKVQKVLNFLIPDIDHAPLDRGEERLADSVITPAARLDYIHKEILATLSQ